MGFLRHLRFFARRSSNGVQSISSEDPHKPAPAALQKLGTGSTLESEDVVLKGDSDAASHQAPRTHNDLARASQEPSEAKLKPEGEDDDEIEIIETGTKVQETSNRSRQSEEGWWSEDDKGKDEKTKVVEEMPAEQTPLEDLQPGLDIQSATTPSPRHPWCLPGSMEPEDLDLDEYLLDQFLEGSGLGFSAQGNAGAGLHLEMPENSSATPATAAERAQVPVRPSSGSMPIGITMEDSTAYLAELHSLEEDHLRLETELLNMGLELDELDEQQALLCSLQEQWEFEADKEVAVLLESLQDLSMSSYCSVEVC